MAKLNSYYDWELSFKNNSKSKIRNKKPPVKKKEPLGINEKLWKEYINSWKKKNLP
jgi:hypothetical protein